jgi:hypothetical protein
MQQCFLLIDSFNALCHLSCSQEPFLWLTIMKSMILFRRLIKFSNMYRNIQKIQRKKIKSSGI